MRLTKIIYELFLCSYYFVKVKIIFVCWLKFLYSGMLEIYVYLHLLISNSYFMFVTLTFSFVSVSVVAMIVSVLACFRFEYFLIGITLVCYRMHLWYQMATFLMMKVCVWMRVEEAIFVSLQKNNLSGRLEFIMFPFGEIYIYKTKNSNLRTLNRSRTW